MPRLPRPHQPIRLKCHVAMVQLGEMWPDAAIDRQVASGQKLGRVLKGLLERLAELLGCEPADLRLDHDPALGARQKIRKEGGEIIGYIPDANDPEHLRYRPHGPQFAGSHLVKTNVRGEHGQHPDRVLIKKQRKLEERERGAERKRPKQKIKGKTFQQMRCVLGARCFCVRNPTRERKRCGNYRPASWGK